MAEVHLCVPVLKRYDLLRNMLASIMAGTVRPRIHVIDNGRDSKRLRAAVGDHIVSVFVPDEPMGLAAAWNWFIESVPEERIIVNDDLIFAPRSLEQMLAADGECVSALAGTNAFSCFLIRDSCVSKVGLFDEEISPGYAYFEDCDYAERMALIGLEITAVECGVVHIGSQTIALNDGPEWKRHHERFAVAKANFMAKWGKLPEGMAS